MKRLMFLIVVLWAPFAAAYEETLKIPNAPELRVALGPREATETFGYVESEFVLRVQLVSAFAFESLNFAPPEVANARLVRLMTPRTKAVTTYVGSGYIYETAYAIFPDRPGELVIPPLVATGKIEPEPGKSQTFTAETLEQRITIKDVPQEFHGDWWVVTPRIHVEEVWSSAPENARVGEVLRREVTMTAYGVEADRLPDLDLVASEGVAVSDHGGARKTFLSSEGVIGKVSRSWDIRVSDPRLAVIGPVTMEHWHPVYHRSLEVGAPAHRIEPAPANTAAAKKALIAEATANRRAGLAAAVALLVLVLSPFVALAFALIGAVTPTAADRKMWRSLVSAPSSKEAWKAANRWSHETGIALPDGAVSYQRLSGAVFAPAGVGADQKSVAVMLMSLSRKTRLGKLRSKTIGWLDNLLGGKPVFGE